jgi:hypothetical protein
MASKKDNKMEIRRWLASLFMLLMLIGLLAFLTFIPVPTANRDIIITVLAVLLGAGSSAIPNLFGDKDAEKDTMRAEISELKQEIQILAAKYQTLADQHDKVTRMLIDRHIVHGNGIVADVAV